jgi:hypothetical protein
VRLKYNNMVNAYNLENSGYRILWLCYSRAYNLTVPPPTALTPPGITCLANPIVRSGSCLTIPFLGGVFCSSDYWCTGDNCTPPQGIDPSLLCQDGTGI